MNRLQSPNVQSCGYGSNQNNRILIVDDNEAIHDDFRKIFGPDVKNERFATEEAAFFDKKATPKTRLQFDMDFALQGEEALKLVRAAVQRSERYAVVFMDMRMPPGWDELETAQKLWEVDSDLQVVICTAYSDYSWDEMMDAIGSPERLLILKKPLDTIEVLQLAHALAEKCALLQASRSSKQMLQSANDELELRVMARTTELHTAKEAAEAANLAKSEFLANMSHGFVRR